MKNSLSGIIFLILLLPVSVLWASNADTLAFGKGEYIQVDASPNLFLSSLSGKVNETSGLIFWQNALWTHNDSGGKPELYKIDTPSGKIIQTIRLEGIVNNDWEDIAQDADHIFVGDFGNNGGSRRDLCVYKIPKNAIGLNEKVISVIPEKIAFSFADQTSFEDKFRKNDFDCESLFAFGDSLYLFTKNWIDGNSRLYVLPKNAGNYKVWPQSTFPADGLITGADINTTGAEVVLVGYKNFQSFIWLFRNFEGNDFFAGQRLRIDFPDLVFVQTEGITYVDEDRILFSCEESSLPPTVFEIKSSQFNSSAERQDSLYQHNQIVLSDFPDTFSYDIIFNIISVPQPGFSVELRNKKWDKLLVTRYEMKDNQMPFQVKIPIRKYKSGTYFIKIISGGKSLMRKIEIKN